MKRSYHISSEQNRKALSDAKNRPRSTWSLDAVEYDARRKSLKLIFPGGVVLGFPVSLISELSNVKASELKEIRLSPSGETLSLDSADVDISTGGLIRDFFRNLPPLTLNSVTGAVRGSKSSALKKVTSAQNGRKGGRPRKVEELEVEEIA